MLRLTPPNLHKTANLKNSMLGLWEWPYVLRMNAVAYISLPPETDGVTRSGVSVLSLTVRIWMWLSQIWGRESFCAAAEAVFCLGDEDALNTAPPFRPNRHMRRMIARRARGIMPASRYAYYGMGGPLRPGVSLAERYDWVIKRCRKTWFHTRHWKYYVIAFFRRSAFRRARKCAAPSQCVLREIMLSPD